jgi:putative DNA primase/helicase
VTIPFDPATVARAAHERAEAAPTETVDVIPRFNGEAQQEAVTEIVAPEFADDSLGLEFTRRFSNALRYVDKWGRWMAWDGKVWRQDHTLRVYDLVRRVCRFASAEAKGAERQRLASGKTVAAVEKLVRSDRRHAASVEQWDADPWLLNTPAGIVDLRSGKMLPHHADHHMTRITAAAPGGDCPQWKTFLARVTGENAKLCDYLQRVSGYCLTGLTTEHAMFFAYGTGRNGKGVFLNTLAAIMGDYGRISPVGTFTAASYDRHDAELAFLQGARLVTAQETEEGRQWAEARVKSLTGGDPITAHFMRQDYFTFIPQFKLFIAGNHKPGLRNIDEAIKSRLNLVPFEITIPKAERDIDLPEKLKAEWPGILLWCLEGCLEWQRIGLSPPDAVLRATDNYFESEDSMGLWIGECCFTGEWRWGPSGELFRSWSKWAKAAGEEALSQKRFGDVLESRGFPRKRKPGTGDRGFERICLVTQPPVTDPRGEWETADSDLS